MAPSHVIDQFHTTLLGDERFVEELQRVALQVAAEHFVQEEDQYDLAMELVTRVGVA